MSDRRRKRTPVAVNVVQRCMLRTRALMTEEAGQDLIEYALIAGLIGLGCIASLKGVSSSLMTLFSAVGSRLINAT